MRRREFITLLCGAEAVWPLVVRAEQSHGVRRVGVLLPSTSNDLQYQDWLAAFEKMLQQFGWINNQNVKIDVRWTTTNDVTIRRDISDLLALAPDVILAHGISTVAPLHQLTRTVPIVFVVVAEPIAAGFVDSLSRPGGNATGFMTEEYGIAGKRLELLKQIAPNVSRIAILFDSTNSASVGELDVVKTMAPSLGVDVTSIDMSHAAQIESAVAAFAVSANSGLIVSPSGLAPRYRDLIVTTAAQYRLPTIYFQRLFVIAGGLFCYGPDFKDEYRRAAGYVDRILKGDKPSDLPVQAPTQYEMVLNLKTAKALGLTVPPDLIALADAVIE